MKRIEKECKWEEKFFSDLEKALIEFKLSEKSFEWVKNDPDGVNAAVSRLDAAIQQLNFLIKQAKEHNLSVDKKDLFKKILFKL